LKLVVPTAERIDNYPYKNLQLICDSTYRRQYPNTGANYSDVVDRDWEAYKLANPGHSMIEGSATYFRVRALWKNVSLQIMKCDVDAVYPDNEFIDKTMQMCLVYFRFLKTVPSHNDNDHTYDLGTSGGIPWCKNKVRSKRDVLMHFTNRLREYIFDLKYPAISSYNDKDELLDTEDLERGKIRGVFGGSFHGIYREKFCYGIQNDKLLKNYKNCWIKYGLVKQYGGFNAAIQTLEQFSFVWESDISGYDRKIYLKFVYMIRNMNVDDPTGEFKDLVDAVTESNMHPLVLLPNGYVVKRKTGNNSGNNNTTTDNSIAHFVIMVYLFTKKLMLIGEVPKLTYIFENAKLMIYSDDKLGGCHLDKFGFESPQDFLDFERDVYLEFGLECKPSTQVWTVKDPGGRVSNVHSFLGSYTHFDESSSMYVPYPRFGKICSSLIQKYNNKDVLIRFLRIMCLVVNSYPNPDIFDESLKYLKWFYDRHPKHNFIFDDALQTSNLEMNSRNSFRRTYLGFEADGFAF